MNEETFTFGRLTMRLYTDADMQGGDVSLTEDDLIAASDLFATDEGHLYDVNHVPRVTLTQQEVEWIERTREEYCARHFPD